jgi:hypothetical protein
VRTLIAVVSCAAHAEYRKAIRETWLPLVPKDNADVLFFMGRGSTAVCSDEIVLDCDDSYLGLPEKVRAIVQYALKGGWDYVFKCDNDVVLLPSKLLASGYETADFVGHKNSSKEDPVPPYGFLYGLSKRSMQIIAEAELPRDNWDEGWVRTKLYAHGIMLRHDPRYTLHFGKKEDYVSKRRPLRFFRANTMLAERPPEGTFAWCMYIPWLGYKNLSAERTIEEFKKVFAENCK